MDWALAAGRLASPLYAPLAPALARLPEGRWPTHEELTAAAAGVTTSRGMPVRFVAPRASGDAERRYYELQVAASGEVQTRAENWHDLFNALVWISFPEAKAAINAQHAAILEERGELESRRRSPERDALTLFDEGGVAIASSEPALFDLIVGFRWKELFWMRRAELEEKACFMAFGHALYEQALEPYLGMVAKTVFLAVEAAFTKLPPHEQAARVDGLLAAHFADRSLFRSPKMMAPMPVLGVPGWHPQTAHEAFYDDPVHFRGQRAR